MIDFNAVIFDLDGTLIDSMGIWKKVDIEFMRNKKIPFDPKLFDEMPEGNSFMELAVFIKDKFSLLESPEEICQEWTDMVKYHYENDIPLKPGVIELLKYLKNQYIKLAIGTSNSYELTEAVLNNNGIRDFFEVIVSGDQDLRGKPYPDIFLKAAESLNVSPESCIVFEDTIAGAKAALNAGMRVISVKDDESKNEWEEIEKIAIFSSCEIIDINKFIEKSMRC